LANAVHYLKTTQTDKLREKLEGCLFRANSKGGGEEMKARAATAGTGHEMHETFESERRQPELAGIPSVEEIRQRVYEIHLERGAMHGRDQDDWLQAERDLAEKHPTSSKTLL
jgi:hypothetical protein